MVKHIHLAFLMTEMIFAILLFLSGFFSWKHSDGRRASFIDRPTVIGNTRVNPDLLYSSKTNKLIIMIIDALRFDMVMNENLHISTLQSWTKMGNHCLIKAKAEAPTVTMPRIKALMTGSVPGYLDVALNFQHYNITEDNFLFQAKSNGLLSVFYGDETWVNVFPNMFNRSESTHSFYVTDYTEVDLNVTRNVILELKKDDWDIMILHYLGLDHIGHLESPYSTLIKPKLAEMDNVIEKILKYISDMAHKSKKVILMIGSDHGMRDAGGHGGTSFPEVTVPYAFVNYYCDSSLKDEILNQIDVTPLMSVLLGLPIPANSIGKLHSKMLNSLPPSVALYAMHYNTIILYNHYEKYRIKGNITVEKSCKSVQEFLKEAEMLYETAILKNFTGHEHFEAFNYYNILQMEMSNAIIKQGVGYDMFSMVFAIVLLGQILFHVILKSKMVLSEKRVSTFAIVLSMMMITSPYRPEFFQGVSILFSSLYLLYFTFFVWNICFFKPQRQLNIKAILNSHTGYEYFLFMAKILHTLLGLSTSFIEEEQIIWYYGYATFLFHALIIGRFNGSIFLLIAHCAFRHLNFSGIKNSNDRDIGDWLMDSNNHDWLLLFYVIGLCLTSVWILKNIKPFKMKNKNSVPRWIEIINKSIIFYFMTLVLLLKFNSGSINLSLHPISPFVDPLHLWIFLIIGVVFCVLWLYYLNLLQERSRFSFSFFQKLPKPSFLNYVLDILILVSCLLYAILCQPHNIILVPYVLFYAHLFKKHCDQNIFVLTVWHLALGMMCFFFQGNSLSLATVDVAVGYRSLKNPNIFISGFLVYFYTMGLPILSTLCLFKNIYSQSMSDAEEYNAFSLLSFFTLFDIIFHSILVIFQRYHLFIWSVYAPKLLYASVHTCTFGILLIMLSLLELLYIMSIQLS